MNSNGLFIRYFYVLVCFELNAAISGIATPAKEKNPHKDDEDFLQSPLRK